MAPVFVFERLQVMQLLKDRKFDELCEALNRQMKLDVAYWVCAFSVTWNRRNIAKLGLGTCWDVGRTISRIAQGGGNQ